MQSVKEAISQMAANMTNSVNSFKVLDDEYEKDNMIYCKTCNEPKLTMVELFGNKRYVRCVCSCDVKKKQEHDEEMARLEKMKDMREMRKNSLLGDRYENVSFENSTIGENQTFDDAFRRCKNYCAISKEALEKGYGIYIWGDKGTGKSHLTACMCNELISKYQQCLFTNFFEISKAIRNTFNNYGESEMKLIDKIATIDFLFIDDLGTELVQKNGEDTWLQEKIFEVINKRYNNKKPTIFTSNYSLGELHTNRGIMEKTVDRILEMSTAILKIEGKSYRMKREDNIPF